MEYKFKIDIIKHLANDIPENKAKEALIAYEKLIDEFFEEFDTMSINDDESIREIFYELGQARERMRVKVVELRETVFEMP